MGGGGGGEEGGGNDKRKKMMMMAMMGGGTYINGQKCSSNVMLAMCSLIMTELISALYP